MRTRPGRSRRTQTRIGGINYYRPFSFRTTGGVSTFSFGVAMAAAWVEPNENRWKVFYLADSLPDRVSLLHLRSDPDWRRLGSYGHFGNHCRRRAHRIRARASSRSRRLQATRSFIYRSDSLRASQSGYITATVTASALTGVEPGVFLGLKDPTKLAELGISALLTGFTDSTGTFIPGSTVATDLSRTTYRVAKFGTDSAAIYSPAGSSVPLVKLPYASLPPAPVRGSGPPNYDRFFFFGNVTASLTSTAATSAWSNVNYEIGAAAP